jgi:hypothetical protein
MILIKLNQWIKIKIKIVLVFKDKSNRKIKMRISISLIFKMFHVSLILVLVFDNLVKIFINVQENNAILYLFI